MKSPFIQLLVRWVMLALGVMIATKIVPGIECNDGQTLIVVVLLLSLCNAILKPLLVLFTLPFIVITMGLGVIVINALLFMLVGHLVAGFYVGGFWSAVGGSIVVSVTNLLVSALAGGTKPPPRTPRRRGKGSRAKRDDAIDI